MFDGQAIFTPAHKKLFQSKLPIFKTFEQNNIFQVENIATVTTTTDGTAVVCVTHDRFPNDSL